MPFSYSVTNSMDIDLIFEVSCDNKLWPMDPKSEGKQSRPNEKQSGSQEHPAAEFVKHNQIGLFFGQSSHLWVGGLLGCWKPV